MDTTGYSTTYLHGSIIPSTRNVIINTIINELKNQPVDFDTIAFTGMSGALIAPIIGFVLNKNILMIRKYGDKHHSNLTAEGYVHSKNIIIIDDQCSTGATLNYIYDSIGRTLRTHYVDFKIKAIILYNDYRSHSSSYNDFINMLPWVVINRTKIISFRSYAHPTVTKVSTLQY
jgi:hypoxanthine phosphoribosyltransferase